MPKGSTFCNDLLKLILNASAIANIADNAGSSPLTNIYLSLHTADPTAGGSQTSNEISYTGYARVAVARTSGGWTITGNVATPASPVTFGTMTGGTGGTVTHIAVGTASSGAGKILWCGAVVSSISVVNGVTPNLTTLTDITES